ncbi:sulfate transporter CysZ [Suttonella sp. R2A3]|uniref:sulfate transporter CysZ n=1 Tax=Suttonella sp. R2A3 TaxID=2908648 RepID=UPI001F21BF83|nr:sulfate transporter CysZ [Suttonella sp. R2A3]UJF23917.1 sulfate transporter CysZ [Suttonella sp. R2A3]
MRAINTLLEGFRWLSRPGLRRYVWVPLSINIVVFALATWGFVHYLNVVMEHFLPADSWLSYLRWVLWPLLAVLFGLIVFYTFSLLANLIAAPFNGFLAAAVERLETGVTPDSGLTLAQEARASISQEVRKTFFFLSRAVVLLILSLIPVLNLIAPFLWFAFSAWVAYLQYMDYPMANHGIRFAEQRRRLRGRPLDTFGFGGLATVMMMVPILNLFAMPVSVIGATLHWCRHIKEEK